MFWDTAILMSCLNVYVNNIQQTCSRKFDEEKDNSPAVDTSKKEEKEESSDVELKQCIKMMNQCIDKNISDHNT